MGKPVLYMDVIGTLLLEKGGAMDWAPFARSFVDAVKDDFEIRFLTTLEEHHVVRVARSLGIEPHYVPFRHALGKTSGIDFGRPFFWVDDDPTPADLLKLSDERCSDRLIPVNRREGVTEQTLRKLQATWKEHQGPTSNDQSAPA